jgi:stage V sporulation protein G
MKVTDIGFRFPKVKHNPEMVALVDIVFDGELKVKDIQLCNGKHGLYISFPRRRVAKTSFYDIFHPISKEFRYMVQEAVVAKYNDMVATDNIPNN